MIKDHQSPCHAGRKLCSALYQDRVEYAWGHPEFTRKYALRGDDKMVAHTQPVLFVVPNFLILGLGYTLEQNSIFNPKIQYWRKDK